MIIPQILYNILLLAGVPAAVLAGIAGVLLLRKGRWAGVIVCGLVMLAGVLGFILALTGTVAGHEMVGGLR